MNEPLVSVWMATYNHGEFVGQALRSALEQDYSNLEVVVADDGSTDGAADVIAAMSADWKDRLVVMPGGPNRGLSGIVKNCNRALRACRGKYVAFLEGDDMFLPGKVRRQVDWLEVDERRVLCGHDVDVFKSTSGKTLYRGSQRTPLRKGLGAAQVVRYGVPFYTPATMVRRSALPESGFDEKLTFALDWKLWIDCLASGGVFGYVDGVLSRYRVHEKSITALSAVSDEVHRAGLADTLVTLGIVESSYPHLISACRYARARIFCAEGTYRLERGDRRGARTFLRSSMAAHPLFSWKVPAWLLSTFAPGRLLDRKFRRIQGA